MNIDFSQKLEILNIFTEHSNLKASNVLTSLSTNYATKPSHTYK